MIPLKDNVSARTIPFVNITLIVINVLAFFFELQQGAGLNSFFQQTAVVPRNYTGPDQTLSLIEMMGFTLHAELGPRLLYSMFLHGGWLHLIGNMLYLWIFGDNVEDRMGHIRYLIFYLTCGWIASFAHIWSDPASKIPSIGASGAIAGVLGAYLTLYPRARVLTILPLGLFSEVVQIPAIFFLGFWFVQQFFYGALSISSRTAQTGGVAWWAHIGGFVGGLALVWLFRKQTPRAGARDDWWQSRYERRSR
jgi:membrane associated rhomboid family serine protease